MPKDISIYIVEEAKIAEKRKDLLNQEDFSIRRHLSCFTPRKIFRFGDIYLVLLLVLKTGIS